MKRYARIVKDHVWGPTGSVLFHLIVLGLLVRFLVLDIDPGPEPQSIVRMDVVSPPVPLDKVMPLMLDDPNVSEVVPRVEIPSSMTEVDLSPVAPEAPEAPGAPESDYRLFPTGISPVEIAGIYGDRFGENRRRALQVYGDGFERLTEPAVLNALDWLKAHQYPDGSWGPQYRAAMTGLAVLSFLAHGETTGSEAYGETVRRGLQSLLRRQRNDGWIVGGGSRVPSPQLRVYEHVIATYALAEGYSMTRIPMLRDPLEDAVQVIIDGQMENGGWTYGFALDGPMQVDVSLGGWIIQALRAAELAGVRNRGLSMAIQGGVRGIGTMTDPRGNGLFGYSQRIPGHAPDAVMTGVAVLVMQLTGRAGDESARAGLLALNDLRFSWLDDSADHVGHRQQVGRWPLYGWYYITQARFQHNRESWRDWNRQFAPGMSGAQNPDGSWCPPPGSIETPYGPVYATTLPALMLQVYYRLLPTYGPIPLDEALTLTDLSDDEPLTIRFQ